MRALCVCLFTVVTSQYYRTNRAVEEVTEIRKKQCLQSLLLN